MHLIIDTDFHFQSVELEQNKSQTFQRDPLLTNVVGLKLISEYSLKGRFIGYSWTVKGWSPVCLQSCLNSLGFGSY